MSYNMVVIRISVCAHAIFVSSQTAEYFIKHGSEIFIATLDAKKAYGMTMLTMLLYLIN